MSEHAIAISRVTKSFGPKVAVEKLDLVVPRGSLYGLIGPNGAGKTTTIRMIMSILFPDSGELKVLGRASALEAKDRIGYLPEERGVYRKMKVGAFLHYVGHLRGMEGVELRQEVERWLEKVGLPDVSSKPCEELSKGMQQKVQFISAVLHRPELLILDEPFSGLDPVNMRLLRDLIREEHRRGTTIIFSTHVMHQAEDLCDHIVMIHDGRKVLDDDFSSIRTRQDPRRIYFEPLDVDADPQLLGRIDGVHRVERTASSAGRRRTWTIQLTEAADADRVVHDLVGTVAPARFELHRPTLEDVFVEIVTRAAGTSEDELRNAMLSGGGEGGRR